MFAYRRFVFALVAPLLLSACLLTPGKFDSSLDIRSDRSFTFAYKGEVIAFDMAKEMTKDLPAGGSIPKDGLDGEDGTDSAFSPTAISAEADKDDSSDFGDTANNDAKMRAIADALSREAGYRSARYVGNSTFQIDYEIHGTLDHGFVYPFNIDAEILFPFIVVELRGKDMVRMKAPGYANSESRKGGMGGMAPPGPESRLDGTFTLTTDAEIVSQNNEMGTSTAPEGRRIVWKVTPLTKDEPMAVLRLKTLP